MVILSCFIREEFFIKMEVNNITLNKLDIVPIFQKKLKRKNIDNKKIRVSLSFQSNLMPHLKY